MAIGQQIEIRLTIHCVPLLFKWAWVVVDEVEDVATLIPLSNTNVQWMRETLDTFLA